MRVGRIDDIRARHLGGGEGGLALRRRGGSQRNDLLGGPKRRLGFVVPDVQHQVAAQVRRHRTQARHRMRRRIAASFGIESIDQPRTAVAPPQFGRLPIYAV